MILIFFSPRNSGLTSQKSNLTIENTTFVISSLMWFQRHELDVCWLNTSIGVTWTRKNKVSYLGSGILD